MQNRMKGILLTVLSAVIFGFTPTLGRLTYDMGSNAVNLTFLRSALALPLLALIAWHQSGTLALRREQILPTLASGILMGSTTILLYSSYPFVGVGMATTIHFIYPLLVALYGVLFGGEKLSRNQVTGLIAGMSGIAFFLDDTSGAALGGVAIAFSSGLTFTGYMIVAARPNVRSVPSFKLSFYIAVISVILALGYGLSTHQITMALTPAAWGLSLFVSWSVMVGAVVLLQMGLRLASATDASFFSLLEPITSVVCGILFLGDSLPLMKGIGCLLILGGLTLFVLSDRKKEAA